MSTFTARYDGRCANDCGTPIRAGEQVRYTADELTHDTCTPAEFKPASVCDRCWTARAANGACACIGDRP